MEEAGTTDGPFVLALSRREDVERSFAVMQQLRPQLTAETYVDTIERLRASGFRLAAVRVGEELVAVAGYRFAESLAWGRHCYIDDFVTLDPIRSRGHGQLLLDWLKAEARANGCQSIQLDSGVQRHAAHRFYFRERMSITCHHFAISLV